MSVVHGEGVNGMYAGRIFMVHGDRCVGRRTEFVQKGNTSLHKN